MSVKLAYRRSGEGKYVVEDERGQELGEVHKEGPAKWWGAPTPDLRVGPFPRRGSAGQALHFTRMATAHVVEVVEPGHVLAEPLSPL